MVRFESKTTPSFLTVGLTLTVESPVVRIQLIYYYCAYFSKFVKRFCEGRLIGLERFKPRAQEKLEFFQVEYVVLTRCWCGVPNPCVCTHKNDRVRTLKIL